jgi:hypothetical protein
MRLLILSASAGGGHVRAGEALAEAATRLDHLQIASGVRLPVGARRAGRAGAATEVVRAMQHAAARA